MPVTEETRDLLGAALLNAMHDRPAHRAFAEHLIAAGQGIPLDGDARWDAINDAAETVPAGVSDSIADAITADLLWILVDSHRDNPAPFPGRYKGLRLRGARRAAGRRAAAEQRAQQGPAALLDRLSFLR